MKSILKLVIALSICMLCIAAQAEEPKTGSAEQQQMPPMGKPAEMNNALKLVGTWTADMQMRMDPTSEYISAPCTMVCEAILDDCALMTHVTTTFMGMPFKGAGMLTYDREKKKWTQSWTDNISANQMWSEGDWIGNTLTVSGSSTGMGKPFMTKDITTIVSDTEISWSLDMSYDGGKTWANTVKATYKKKV